MTAEPASASRICKRALVAGRVQGVFYRASTVSRARELGVDGFARNLPDGCVEVVACGPIEAVDALARWLWKGSAASRVTAVQVETLDGEPFPAGTGFSAR